MVEAAFLYLSHSDLLPYLVLSSRVCKSDSYSFKALRLAKHFKCNTLHLALQPHYQQAPPGVVAKPCSASMPEMQCDCAARAASLDPHPTCAAHLMSHGDPAIPRANPGQRNCRIQSQSAALPPLPETHSFWPCQEKRKKKKHKILWLKW